MRFRDAALSLVDGLLAEMIGARCVLCATRVRKGCLCPHCVELILVEPSFRQEPLSEASYGYVLTPSARRLLAVVKDGGRREPFLQVLERAVRPSLPVPDGVVAVPPDPVRAVLRGFHLPSILARWLAVELGAPVLPLLSKNIPTATQRGTGKSARRANVRGAYVCGAGKVQLRLLLVDDVWTTGATLGECSRALRNAGAGEIRAWAMWRAPKRAMPDHRIP